MNAARLRMVVQGAVQGVGFRPFIHRLATRLDLAGWVANTADGLVIEVEGDEQLLRQFETAFARERPAQALITGQEVWRLHATGARGFEIRHSLSGTPTVAVQADLATCPDCFWEVNDPTNRRYQYPFINCTACGPRYSIVDSLPYDRSRTTMAAFEMCDDCEAEYRNPADRRFHAQPNACPVCGPHVELWNRSGAVVATRHEALLEVAEALWNGQIVAVKGLGGFHLWADARNEQALRRLRERKHRQEKPFALMVPDAAWVRSLCDATPEEEAAFLSAQAPIVLMKRRNDPESLAAFVSPSVAPGVRELGLMRPYTALHHLLLTEFPFPVVATSGNLSEEPICIDERKALKDLRGLADVYLVHNRPIRRAVDDSVVRIVAGRELLLRRARGYAPLPITLGAKLPPLLAAGGQMKSAIAATAGPHVFLSQPIGDLETRAAVDAFHDLVTAFQDLYEVRPEAIACDAHPDYQSSREIIREGRRIIPVQHHYAHALACLADNDLEAPALACCWDGSGYGLDGTVWGGEFLRITPRGFDRLAHLRAFRLPGGERAVREPRRSAFGLLWELFGAGVTEQETLAPVAAFTPADRAVLATMVGKGLLSPVTTSAGRLFDAVASLLGLRQAMRYEGQAAMELEALAADHEPVPPYPFVVHGASPWVVDWGPMIHAMLAELGGGSAPRVAARFHETLADIIVAVARRAGERDVLLTGGCFQNRLLTERAIARLQEAGFRPFWHQRLPPNDGSLAVGQALAAARILQQEVSHVSRHSRPG